MINLKFNKLMVEGFQSIGKTNINFKNLGTCFIKGINNYDSKTKSNGSGKSSLLLSLYWCLFDKTPAGVTNNVVNKFYDNGCCVELELLVDDVSYTIRRSINHKIYKTDVVILKEHEDISGRIKSDSNKLIKDIIHIDEEIFSQMIFLSQGFNNRFAIYTPKARKELLESMYNINEKLDEFVNKLKFIENNINQILSTNNKKSIQLSTKMQMTQKSIDVNEETISTLKNKLNELVLKNYDFDVNEKLLNELKNKSKELDDKILNINNKIHEQNISINTLDIEVQNIINEINTFNIEINKFSNSKICPTCGTILEDYSKNEHIQKHIADLKSKIINLSENYKNKEIDLNKCLEIKNKLLHKQNKFKQDKNNIDNELKNKSLLYEQKIKKDVEIKNYKDKIVEEEKNLNNSIMELRLLNAEFINVGTELEVNNNKLNIIQHCIRLANNQFKAYLLGNIISLLNNKLEELSTSLFENEIIKINNDNKLDIMLGDKLYEQLSGGEKTKIDIAIIIAQRYLAQQMNSISSNILITDEIFDGLDDTSFGILLDILSNEVQDVESIFIISHRDVNEIPFDNSITVVKNKNQVSDVIMN